MAKVLESTEALRRRQAVVAIAVGLTVAVVGTVGMSIALGAAGLVVAGCGGVFLGASTLTTRKHPVIAPVVWSLVAVAVVLLAIAVGARLT